MIPDEDLKLYEEQCTNRPWPHDAFVPVHIDHLRALLACYRASTPHNDMGIRYRTDGEVELLGDTPMPDGAERADHSR